MANFLDCHQIIEDLNYDKYFEKGKEINEQYKEYTSHNAKILTVHEIKKILLGLIFLKDLI